MSDLIATDKLRIRELCRRYWHPREIFRSLRIPIARAVRYLTKETWIDQPAEPHPEQKESER